jgi:hypothetical protein
LVLDKTGQGTNLRMTTEGFATTPKAKAKRENKRGK